MSDDEKVADPVGASPADAGAEGLPGEPQAGSTAEQQLVEALERAETNYKNWQRAAADFANFKRRTEQERAETARFASASLVINLLPVYDDLERAVGTVDANLAGLNWVQGVVAIQRKFKTLLDAMQVSEIAAAGELFDPALHEAVANQPGEEGRVLHVVQKGYRLGDRVIRPAMVIVGEG
ncbi:MAG: nucleotide exchange factor GrpE [Dehalococcoidia bacterium]|nr:nucleotide exchange factor GrpE [Dehalococcoidia bacterium]